MSNTALAPMKCMCGQLIQPKKGWLGAPRTISCPECAFKFAVATQSPDSVMMCLREAENLVDRETNQSYGKAITLASIGLAKDAKLLALRFTRAFALDKLKQYSRAILDWQACVDGGHRTPGSAMKLGSSYYESGKFREAVDLFDRIIDGDLSKGYQREGINRYSVLMLRGRALAESGDFDKAISDFTEVKSHSAPSGQTDCWILVCRHRGDKKRALAEVTRQLSVQQEEVNVTNLTYKFATEADANAFVKEAEVLLGSSGSIVFPDNQHVRVSHAGINVVEHMGMWDQVAAGYGGVRTAVGQG